MLIRWQLELLWPLVAVLLVLTGFGLYVLVHSERRYRLKLVLIPALLAGAVFSFAAFGSRLGYGYPAGLPVSFEYIAHKVVLIENRKTWIDVLVVSRRPLERDARLHRLPWSQDLEDSFKQGSAMQSDGEGGSVEMDRGSSGDAYPKWVPKRVKPQDVMPKDPIPGQPDMLQPKPGLTA